MYLRLIIWILVAYFAYQFLVNFVFPLVKVSRRMRQHMNEFQRQQQQPGSQQNTYNNSNTTTNNNSSATKPKAGDYIDFEEVKD